MSALQKLLMPWQSRDVLTKSTLMVGGPVVRLGDAQGLATPAELLAAYGLGEDRFGAAPEFVDVVRFLMVPLMELARSTSGEAPWPTYSTGFLRSEHLIPVWSLGHTRFPQGSEVWRIHADGSQEPVSVLLSSARGWDGATSYTPPSTFVGPLATWRGSEYAADFADPTGAVVELVAVGAQTPEGFTGVRPMISTRSVPAAECESVVERVVSATWRGAVCRVVRTDAQDARLLLVTDDPDAVARLGADEVEPGVFEVTAPLSELTDLGGVVRELQPPTPAPRTAWWRGRR